MEKLQDGVLWTLAAAAGCYLENPSPDPGIDWVICHESKNHKVVRTAKIEIALKCTYQLQPNNQGHFSFTLENDHLEVLAEPKIVFPRILCVMMIPRDADAWTYSRHNWFLLRHSMYWVNLKNNKITGKKKTNVRVPYRNKIDALELCRLLEIVGDGGTI